MDIKLMRARSVSIIGALLLALAFLGVGATPQGHVTLGATASAQMPVPIVFPPTVAGGGGVLRTDNFNRTDTASNIGTPSDGGSAYVQNSGTWGINGNAGYQSDSAAGNVAVSLEASNADVDVQVTMTTTGDDYGLVARLADDNNYLMIRYSGGAGGLQMYKRVAGTFTEIDGGVGPYSPANGDVLKFTVHGSTLNAYVNGTLRVGPITETAGQTNTKHGLFVTGSADTAASRYDTFSITAN